MCDISLIWSLHECMHIQSKKYHPNYTNLFIVDFSELSVKEEYSGTGISSGSASTSSSGVLDVDNQPGPIQPHSHPPHASHTSLPTNPTLAPHNAAHSVPHANSRPTHSNPYSISSATTISGK